MNMTAYGLQRGGSVRVISASHKGELADKAKTKLRSAGYDFTPQGIAAFQRDHDLPESGDVDPMTMGALSGIASAMARGGAAKGTSGEASPVPTGGGLIHSDVPGRTDRLPTAVPMKSYIIPADVVSVYGQGNTIGGGPILDQIFARFHQQKSPATLPGMAQGGAAKNKEDHVPIIVAGGEYVVDPETVTAIGGGDAEAGHRILDKMVVSVRKQGAKHMMSLPGPKT